LRRLRPWLCPPPHWQHHLRCTRQQHQEERARQSRSCHGEQEALGQNAAPHAWSLLYLGHLSKMQHPMLGAELQQQHQPWRLVWLQHLAAKDPALLAVMSPFAFYSCAGAAEDADAAPNEVVLKPTTHSPLCHSQQLTRSALGSHVPVVPCCMLLALLRIIPPPLQ
jgi:hypothetical protein